MPSEDFGADLFGFEHHERAVIERQVFDVTDVVFFQRRITQLGKVRIVRIVAIAFFRQFTFKSRIEFGFGGRGRDAGTERLRAPRDDDAKQNPQ